jgi:ribosome-binding protein aMBF1 (putative translation factor)
MADSPEPLILTVRVSLQKDRHGRWQARANVINHQDDDWPSDPDEFAQAMRAARSREGVSQDELARITGLSAVHLRNIESGRYVPSPRARGWIVSAMTKLGLKPDPPFIREKEKKTDEPDKPPNQTPQES